MMHKGKLTILLTVVFAIVALFTATPVMAQNGDCFAPDSVKCGDCTLTAIRGTNGEFPVPEMFNGTLWYKVEYEYSGANCNVAKFDHVYFTLEDNECYDPITVKTQGGVDDYPSGEGASDNDFAKGVHNNRVVRINPQGNKAYFYVDTKNPGKSSNRWTAGRKEFDCDGPIISVGYDPVRPVGTSSSGTECLTIETGQYPISVSLTRNSLSGLANVYSVRFWRSENCTLGPDDPTGGNRPDTSTPGELVYCTGGPGTRNECFRLTSESPGCVDYYIGGTLCHFCW